MTPDELQAIRERDFAHFRIWGPKSSDHGAIDRRALLSELDASRKQLRAAEKVAERYWKLRDGDAGSYCVRSGELAHGDELDALLDAKEPTT